MTRSTHTFEKNGRLHDNGSRGSSPRILWSEELRRCVGMDLATRALVRRLQMIKGFEEDGGPDPSSPSPSGRTQRHSGGLNQMDKCNTAL